MTYLFDTSHQDLEFAIGLDNYAFVTSMDVLVFVQLASYPIAQPPTDWTPRARNRCIINQCHCKWQAGLPGNGRQKQKLAGGVVFAKMATTRNDHVSWLDLWCLSCRLIFLVFNALLMIYLFLPRPQLMTHSTNRKFRPHSTWRTLRRRNSDHHTNRQAFMQSVSSERWVVWDDASRSSRAFREGK